MRKENKRLLGQTQAHMPRLRNHRIVAAKQSHGHLLHAANNGAAMVTTVRSSRKDAAC